MMAFTKSFSEKSIGLHGKAGICNVCGKEGQRRNIVSHIEANHMAMISIPCDDCGKFLNTRQALNRHQQRYHSQPEFASIFSLIKEPSMKGMIMVKNP